MFVCILELELTSQVQERSTIPDQNRDESFSVEGHLHPGGREEKGSQSKDHLGSSWLGFQSSGDIFLPEGWKPNHELYQDQN